MDNDPNRTKVLPSVGFPITEELPAVVSKRQRDPGGSGFLKLAAGLLIMAMVAIAAVLIIGNRQTDTTASTGSDGIEQSEVTADAPSVLAPTPVELVTTAPGYWQVAGVPDGLNVRSGPGIDNDIVGSLRADDRHVFGTGERATVAGAEWTQVSFGENDTVGWVSSRFLVGDTAPDPNAPAATATPITVASLSVVCFQSQQDPLRTARLEFTDRTDIVGVLRTTEAGATTDQAMSGTLRNGAAEITLTDLATGATSTGTWTFSPASVTLANSAVLSVVDCVAIDLP